MMAALSAASSGLRPNIIIYEKNNRVGKKILATGNGRCNITNTDCRSDNYHGNNPEFIKTALDRFPPEHTIEYFNRIGLMCKITHGGRVFPYCEQASAVLDVLRFALARAGVEVRTGTHVVAAECKAKEEGFHLYLHTSAGEETVGCDRLIVSSGGKAAPSTGSDGGGFALLSSFGHRIIEPYPALTQLKTDTKIAASLRGVRVNGLVSVKERGSPQISVSDGEIQFTAYGLSGPAIMDISAAALKPHGDRNVVVIDLMPHMDDRELREALFIRKRRMSHLLAEDFLVGMLNKKVGQLLLKHSGIEKLSLQVKELGDTELSRLAKCIKGLEFSVKGHTGWEHAQATGGGVDTYEFSAMSMESKIVNGLFATGEVLDIYGDCGGYNLQWAWSSGHTAGLAAAEVRA